jgi:hypothetical protein
MWTKFDSAWSWIIAGPTGVSVDEEEAWADCLSTRKRTSRAQTTFCEGSKEGDWTFWRADWRRGIVGRGAVREGGVEEGGEGAFCGGGA